MVQIKKQNIKVLDFADKTVDGYNRSTETAKKCLITSRNIGTVWTERRVHKITTLILLHAWSFLSCVSIRTSIIIL